MTAAALPDFTFSYMVDDWSTASIVNPYCPWIDLAYFSPSEPVLTATIRPFRSSYEWISSSLSAIAICTPLWKYESVKS
jgi:hypothetical protein